MDTTYKNLNLSIYPLAKDISNTELSYGNNILPISNLSTELLDFFKNNQIVLANTFNVLVQNVSNLPDTAYTDGDYDGTINRTCAVNWNFSANTGTVYKFYNVDGATSTFDGNRTIWTNVSNVASPDWTTFGPVLLNPQLPYVPSSNSDTANNLISLSLYFKESWPTMNKKLANNIITPVSA
jgi:hypothetical protein